MKRDNHDPQYKKTLKRSRALDYSFIIVSIIIIVNLCFMLYFVRIMRSETKSQTDYSANAAYGYTLSSNAKTILHSVTPDGFDKSLNGRMNNWIERTGVTMIATYNDSVVYNSTGMAEDEFFEKYKEILGDYRNGEYSTGLRITQTGTLALVRDEVEGNKRQVFLVDPDFTFETVDTESFDKFFTYAGLIMIIDLLSLVALMFNRHLYSGRVEKYVTEPITKLKRHLDEMLDDYFDHEASYAYDNEIGEIYRSVDHIRLKLRNYQIEHKNNSESKKVMVSGLMHDIATPITRINGCASMIRDGIVTNDDEIRKYADLIVTNTEDIDVLLKKLGELAKYDENIIQNHMIPVSIEPLIRRYVNQISVELSGMDAECEFISECEVSPVCMIDVRSAKRVIMNIIYNSVKYKKSDTHCIITIKTKMSANGDCIVSFADNGIGIEKGSEDKIFDMFYREDGSRSKTSDDSGLGLGLFFSREIVMCNNGHIWAKNNKDGLTVFISLPVTNEPPVEWN